MSDYIISEEQLQTFDVATLAEDEYIDSEIFAEIRSHPLSEELKAERGRVIEELSNETKIRNMHIENGEFELETEGVYGHQLIRLLTDFYESNGGENYFTMTVCGRVRNKYRRYEITIRNADGDKTPADTIAELRKEIESSRSDPTQQKQPPSWKDEWDDEEPESTRSKP